MLTTTSTTNLSENTQIGKVVAKEIQRLTGVKDNIQRQFDVLVKKDLDLDELIEQNNEALQKLISEEVEARKEADKTLKEGIDAVDKKIFEANISNLVTLTGDAQTISSDKTFESSVVVNSNTGENIGGLVVLGQAANHPLRVRGISGINADKDAEDALYLNYDGTNDLEKYLERPVRLGGSDDYSVAVRKDMLDNAIAAVKKEILTGDSDEKISETYDTLLEISNWIANDESGTAKIVADLDRAVYKTGESGEGLTQDILGTLLLNGGQVYVNAASQTISNINTMKTPGQYGISGSATNIPVKQSGTLYVAEYSRGNWCQQTYITNPDEGSIRIFRRGALTSNSDS